MLSVLVWRLYGWDGIACYQIWSCSGLSACYSGYQSSGPGPCATVTVQHCQVSQFSSDFYTVNICHSCRIQGYTKCDMNSESLQNWQDEEWFKLILYLSFLIYDCNKFMMKWKKFNCDFYLKSMILFIVSIVINNLPMYPKAKNIICQTLTQVTINPLCCQC